jgi:hypothetical protein
VTVGSSLTAANNITATSGTMVMASSFLRNRIINGNMQVWQRGTSFTTVGSGTWTYTADRMATYCQNTSTTISQNTSVPTNLFQYSLKLQRTAANTGTNPLVVSQVIESVNCYDLSGQTVTLSFYAKTGANYSGGNLTVVVYTGTAADQGINTVGSWTGIATPISTTQALSTTWTRYSFTGTFGSGVLEAAPYFLWTPTGTAGADDAVYITGVQLEPGSVATPFERRQYGEELVLCQRYYQQYNNAPLVSGNTTGGTIYQDFIFSVVMRSSPTGALSGTFTYSNASAYTFNSAYVDHMRISLNITAAGYGFGYSGVVTLSAEL